MASLFGRADVRRVLAVEGVGLEGRPDAEQRGVGGEHLALEPSAKRAVALPAVGQTPSVSARFCAVARCRVMPASTSSAWRGEGGGVPETVRLRLVRGQRRDDRHQAAQGDGQHDSDADDQAGFDAPGGLQAGRRTGVHFRSSAERRSPKRHRIGHELSQRHTRPRRRGRGAPSGGSPSGVCATRRR